MSKQEFKAESKRLLELMINSIYTHKEIFLRELISNASDAIDKRYYKALTREDLKFNKEDFFIKVIPDKEKRTLRVLDTGIGMTKEELEDNLGTIAKSGSLAFKNENEVKEGIDIIGQFGIGFYSAFMVADHITVKTKALDSDEAYRWESDGVEGYTIETAEKADAGTEVIIKVRENTEEENYDEYLEDHRLQEIIKKYSDFVRYPIKMDLTTQEKVEKESDGDSEDKDPEYKEVVKEETVNSMVPMWRKNKSQLTDEDYINFYQEKRYGFDKPLKHIHMKADGTLRYSSILYIPEQAPYDFYTKEYEKGLELYSSGVLIMEKCPDLLPDYFSFVKGMVDSEDLSLNISREMLQHDRQLQIIGKKIKEKIKTALTAMLKNDREKYESFFNNFGKQIKYGVYSDFGQNKETLQDLLLFYSSKRKKMVTLKEYVEGMKEDQEHIYYASGDSVEKIDKMPQTEMLKDKDYEILYFTDEVDEFAIKMLMNYEGKTFKSVSSGDLEVDKEEEKESKEEKEEFQEIFNKLKEILGDKVKDVRPSKRLKNHAVCLAADGELSIEMEKILQSMPDGAGMKSEKVLEINTDHKMFKALQKHFASDEEKVQAYANVFYNQALLMEGITPEDPVAYSNDVFKLIEE
ncbi:molecular chaperone HtpG [Isachenkonia alkalipeptolytica]|uniref:Chaperone protein HtpG n=1 Tax=Isachenkonia alkalipeptolytica TaxID=2565777 RepID=A0AA43XJ26_9CLOT|nr:molecular chaperone HtpG [Isachenkonia alkalipeptolytica]NBG87244.1 molecular chaperone HtpG [Isachenkonia alkalipeptolytica]